MKHFLSRVRSRVSSGSFLTCKLTWQKCTLIVNIEFYFNHIKDKWNINWYSNWNGCWGSGATWLATRCEFFLTFLMTNFWNYFLGYWLYRTGAFFSKFNDSTSSNNRNNWIYRRCSWKYRLFNATKWFLSVCYSYFYHSSYLIDPTFLWHILMTHKIWVILFNSLHYSFILNLIPVRV